MSEKNICIFIASTYTMNKVEYLATTSIFKYSVAEIIL